MAREAVLKSGLSAETPAQGVYRACATSLDGTINIANKIAMGQIEVGIAGGAECMSDTPLFLRSNLSRRIIRSSQSRTLKDRVRAWKGFRIGDLKPASPPAVEQSTKKTMGQHCEMMVQDWGVSREEQDQIAVTSHANAARAYERGFFRDLVYPFRGVERDNTVRGDTKLEKLASLKPVFDRSGKGSLTAGNSSPLTDGAACVLLASEEWAAAHGFKPLAYLAEYESAAIDLFREALLIAPAYAAARMLTRSGMQLQDFDFYEIHEAFAGQVAATLKAFESDEFCRTRLGLTGALGAIDRSRMNVAGGSVAVGHPFGATGARLVATAAKLLEEKGKGKAFLSICAGGGMGTVAVLER
jgi:acetyl-CoA C-acetyltransferase